MDEQAYINGLIELHKGLARQGPGDDDFSRALLKRLPAFSRPPRIAELGCGAGIASLLLAREFGCQIKSVDFSIDFLNQLKESARQQGFESLIEPIHADMSALDWPHESIDLLWSEGAAYAIGFSNALNCWRPLMAKHGVVVISELSVFSDPLPAHLGDMLQVIYPAINTEAGNRLLIQQAGYRLLETTRLPAQAWWDNYYGPLQGNIEKLRNNGDAVLQQVIKDTESEMEFFRQHGEECGYSFYVMQVE